MALSPFPFPTPAFEAIREAGLRRPLDGLPPTARGNTVTLAPNQAETILRARNSSEQGECVGVTLALTTDDRLRADEGPDDVFVWPQVRALLEWGSGNGTVQAEVDFMSGSCLTITCETITVGASYRLVKPPWLDQAPFDRCCAPTFRATALLGYGGPRGAQLTELVMLQNPDDSELVPVPQFAASLAVLPCALSQVTIDLLPCGSGFRVPDVIVAPLSNLAQENSIISVPLMGGARHIRVTNRNTAGPAFAFVVFRLDL